MCRASRRFPHLSFIPSVPYPPLRGTFPSRGRLCIGDSDALVYDTLETIFSLSFIPLVPYPARFARHLSLEGKALSVVILFFTYACIRSDNARKAAFSYRRSLPPWGRGTAQRWIGCSRKRRTCDDLLRSLSYRFPHPTSAPSGHLLPKEGGSVHASPFPWKGLPSAARRGWLPFEAAKPPPLCLPHWGKGTAQRRSGVLVNDALVTIFFALFHTASPIQPPPLRGTSFHRKAGVSTRAPSLGRGCRAQRGGVGFLFCSEAASSLPSPLGKALCREKRYPRIVASPIREGGPRSGARVFS